MTAAIVAAVLVVLIVCGTLVTRWALKFAAEGAVGDRLEVEGPPEEEKEVDPAVMSVLHLDGWDEIVFGGRRYRRCVDYGSPAYCQASVGWLYYPEGTPLGNEEWYVVHKEYERRSALDRSNAAAVAARRVWDEEQRRRFEDDNRGAIFTYPERRPEEKTEAQLREEELDRRVEEARMTMGRDSK